MLVLGLSLSIGFGSMSGCKKDTTEADKAAAELKAKQQKETDELKAKQQKEADELKARQAKEAAELAEKEAKKWTLTAPGDATLKQGDKTDITIKLDRGKKSEDDVAISFSDLPKGVTVSPESGTIAKGKTEMKFTLTAAKDAPVAEGKEAKVTAKGGDIEKDARLKITVKKKE
jgi:hypothetical protein